MAPMASTANTALRALVDRAGGIPAFSRLTGRPRALVWQLYNRRRPVPPGWCEGLCAIWPDTTPEALRPDYLFHRGPDGRLYWRPRT